MKANEFGSVSDLCRALVQIPSENPTGRPEAAGEGAMAQFVGDYLAGLGAEIEFEKVVDDRPNVYGRFPGPASSSRLMLAPHLDTVPVTGMTVDPFGGELRDGRIYGRGASDTKGPMAAMLWALKEMDRAHLGAEVVFAGLVDEEVNQLGAKVCADRHLADFVVVGEPTDLGVVYTHKGTCWLKLEAFGRAAHASAPDLGVNAIERLGHVYAELKQHFPSLRPSNPHPTLGSATISLGVIRGGSKINVVPDHCEAEIDIRTLPGQEGMAEAVQEFLTARQLPARVTVIKVSEPLFTNPEHPLVALLASLGAPLVGAPWFCDAAFFAAAGTPAVAVGPGCIREAHTADEHIEVAALERGAAFFTEFLQTFSHA
jgi:acetylornithine deacetylase/succinyl-diaminopimelate desuccinylase family protein